MRRTGLVLTLMQPWAWLVVHGPKDIENRTWRTNVRGLIGIHAGAKYDAEGARWIRERFPELADAIPPIDIIERGGIVGRVELIACVTESTSPWFVGPFGFVLRNREPLPFRPCRGALGFWRKPGRAAAK